MVAARDLKHMLRAPQDLCEMRIPHTDCANSRQFGFETALAWNGTVGVVVPD